MSTVNPLIDWVELTGVVPEPRNCVGVTLGSERQAKLAGPHLNQPSVERPLGLTEPVKTAEVEVMLVAEVVVTVGAAERMLRLKVVVLERGEPVMVIVLVPRSALPVVEMVKVLMQPVGVGKQLVGEN